MKYTICRIKEQLLELLKQPQQKDILLFLHASKYEFEPFLKEHLQINSSQLASDELELLNFAREAAEVVELEHSLQDMGISSNIATLFLPVGKFDSMSDLELASLVTPKETQLNIYLVLEREPFSGNSAHIKGNIEEHTVFTSAIIKDSAVELAVELSGERFAQDSKKLLLDIAKDHISLDMINICDETLYFIAFKRELPKLQNLLSKFNVSIKDEVFKLSLVGVGMKGAPGVMFKIYKIFQKKGIPILRSTDSHTTISCLISQAYRGEIVSILEEEFGLPESAISFD